MNKDVLQNILFKEDLTKSEVNTLLNLNTEAEISLLLRRADQVRKDNCGEEVHFRGAIEISNHCRENCEYCGIREGNYSIQRYRMEPDEIIETANRISKLGIYTIVLKAGEDEQLDSDIISYLIYSIKSSSNVAVTLSLGERGFDDYRSWKIAGADRYILRHDSCRSNIIQNQNEKSFIDRVKHLQYLKRLGFQIGSGSLVGLPNQSSEAIVDDIFLMKELNVDMVSFAPFIPAEFTPFHSKSAGSVELTLKTLAAARLVLKNVHIPATLSLDSIDINGREKGLNSGANVVIPDFTPHPYRENYKVYSNRRYSKDDPLLSHKNLRKRIEKLGRQVSFSRGDSLKNAATIII